MSCDQALDKLSEKLNSRLLVQEEHGFQKGAQCAPLAAGSQKKPGLDWVKECEIAKIALCTYLEPALNGNFVGWA